MTRIVVLSAIIVGALVTVAAIILALTSRHLIVLPDVQYQLEGTGKGSANCITGTITKVVDGDTLDIDNTKIRLALVNTPEIDEKGYEESRQFTSKLCPVGFKAIADEDDGQTAGRYGRMIAKVTCVGGKVLNEELLKAHMAKILTEFCDRSEFRNERWALNDGC